MAMLLLNHSDALAAYAAARIPHVGSRGFGPCFAIGIAEGLAVSDELMAVCVYHDYQGQHGTIQISLYASTPRWATRGTIRALLHYPFEQLGVRKLWMAIPHRNERAIRFNLGIGFRKEATLRQQFSRNDDAVILYMLRTDYQKSRWYVRGKEMAA